MKFCKDCKKIKSAAGSWNVWLCGSTDVVVGSVRDSVEYRVSGKPDAPDFSCATARITGGLCGPEAKFWEAK